MSFRYVSVFSGIEAATVAFEPLGWEPVAFCEIDDFPSAVLRKRYPSVPNLGDITKVDWTAFKEDHGAVDLVIGGSPCFTAGTLVLCEDGFKPIEQVEVGERVVTHKGRLRRVVKTGHQQGRVSDLKVHGMMPITCTPNHPILTSRRLHADKRKAGDWWKFEDEKFVPAGDSVGLCACSVTRVDCDIPEFPDVYGLDRQKVLELIGWYLGDGSIAGKGKRNPTIRTLELSISPKKLVRFVSSFKQSLSYRVDGIDNERCRVLIHCTELCRFIERWFGRGAKNKNLPAWVYALTDGERASLVSGYAATDGSKDGRGFTIFTSVSKALIVGMQQLVGQGSACAPTARESRVIRGVEYKTLPTYQFSYRDGHSRSRKHNGYAKRLIVSYDNERDDIVYNLEVEGDHSYTADGVAVHNCQSFSLAGKREGLSGASGLMYEYVRCVRELMPSWFIWENVPGALSVERGWAFEQLLTEMDELGYGLGWRVLDAQFARIPVWDDNGGIEGWIGPVAQRRRRVFLVGHLGDTSACEVLFESESLRWDHPSSKQKREELARAAGRGVGAGGDTGSLNGRDAQAKRIFTDESCAPTLNSGTNEGMNIQLSVLQETTAVTQDGEYISRPLIARMDSSPSVEGRGPSIVAQSVGFKFHQGAQAGNIGYEGEQSPTLTADWHQPAVAYAMRTAMTGANGIGIDSELGHTPTQLDQKQRHIKLSTVSRKPRRTCSNYVIQAHQTSVAARVRWWARA